MTVRIETEQAARLTLAVAVTGSLISLVTYTAPLTTLTLISRGLHSGPDGQTWVLSGMSLGLAAFLLTAGALADDLGRRRVFVLGNAVLAISSVLAAVSPVTGALIAARIAQGVGAAAVVACSLGLIAGATAPGPARARATGMWGASVGAGIALGPLVAAALAPALTWRAVYWVIAAVCVALIVIAQRRLPESRAAARRRVDLLGMTLLSAALAALCAGLVEGRDGWTRPVTVVLLLAAVLLFAAFVPAQLRTTAPMLDLSLLRNRDFLAVTVAALVAGLSVIALMSYLPTIVQRGLGGTALTASYALLGWSVTSIATSLLARRLPPVVTGGRQLAAGTVIVAVGELLLTRLSPGQSLWLLVPGLVVTGAGSGLVNAALGKQAVASVPADRAAMGSGANNTARYLGSAVGVTLVVVIVAARAPGHGLLSAWNTTALLGAIVSLVGAVAIIACRS